MKKAITLIITVILFGALSDVVAQKNRALSNGFSIIGQVGFPSDEFGTSEPVDSEFAYGVSWGLQIGNRWYFSPQEKYGFGLMVNWVDVTWVRKNTETTFGKIERATLDIGVGEVGPVGTYAFSEALALDAYYNLRPTIMSTAYQIDNDDSEGYGGFGVTHAFGAGFRYNMLFFGLEYVVGTVKVTQETTDIEIMLDEKIKADCFRILFGLKF